MNKEEVPLDNRTLEIQTNSKVIEMNKVFTNLFNMNKLTQSDYFTSTVWFVMKDDKFQKMVNMSTPGGGYERKIYEIIRELSNTNETKKVSINVLKFINKLCEILFSAQVIIDRTQTQIDLYKAHENVNVLEEKIKLLQEKRLDKTYSTCEVAFKSNDLVSSGYELIFYYTEMSPNDPTITTTKKLNLTNSENSFTFSALALGETNKSRFINSDVYSGSTFSSYRLYLVKSGELYAECDEENFIFNLLNSLNELKETEKHSISIETTLNMVVNKSVKYERTRGKDFNISINLKLTLDTVTKASILYRIGYTLHETIKIQAHYDSLQKEILDCYFPEISDRIRDILKQNELGEADGACNCKGCGIF
jgi:hypothetical protein